MDHIIAHPKRIQHLICDQDISLDEFLSSHLNLSNQDFLKLLELGAIYINQQRQMQNINLKAQDYIRVHLEPKRFSGFSFAQDWIIQENDDFIIFNKPSGLPCHPTLDNFQENLLEISQKALQIPLFITHRLDVPTSGLLLMAKNKMMLKHFNKSLEAHQVQKIYDAQVLGRFQIQTKRLIHYMKKEIGSPKKLTEIPTEDSLLCELEVLSAITKEDNLSHLKIQLHTGRTHQIRAQLSFIGHPIVGDTLYGAAASDSNDKIKLHCSSLQFPDRNDSKKLWSIESSAPF